jgi:magnesium transporter
LAGIYGMNFTHIPWAEGQWNFLIFCLIIAAVMVASYVGFKHNKWS